MKAIQFREFGGPEVLEYVDAPEPVAGRNEVIVDLKAAGLNHVDIDIRKGVSRFDFAMPHILGLEGAGVITEVGPDSPAELIGTRVALSYNRSCGRCEWCIRGLDNQCLKRVVSGEHIRGTYAERIALPAVDCIEIAPSLDFATAAASIVSFGTAWHGLVSRAGVRVGETVLIHSVGSGVGSAALQVARAAGAVTIVTASTDEKLAIATDNGADHTVNYRSTDLFEVVMDVTGGRGVDVVVDVVGGEGFARSMALLKPYGRLVSIGAHGGEKVTFDIVEFFRRQITYMGSQTQSRGELMEVLKAVGDGQFAPRIHSSYRLEDAADAHRELEARQHYGKIVLTME